MASMFPQPAPSEKEAAEEAALDLIEDAIARCVYQGVTRSRAIAKEILEATRKFQSSSCPVCTTELDGDGHPVVD